MAALQRCMAAAPHRPTHPRRMHLHRRHRMPKGQLNQGGRLELVPAVELRIVPGTKLRADRDTVGQALPVEVRDGHVDKGGATCL